MLRSFLHGAVIASTVLHSDSVAEVVLWLQLSSRYCGVMVLKCRNQYSYILVSSDFSLVRALSAAWRKVDHVGSRGWYDASLAPQLERPMWRVVESVMSEPVAVAVADCISASNINMARHKVDCVGSCGWRGCSATPQLQI
jgi:hypothetical protein